LAGISYLKDTIRGSIISDVVEVAKLHSAKGKGNAGWFSIPRLVFCYVDCLGAITYNNRKNEDGASTRKAARFIREYFPKEYGQYGDLLIATWRHGTVHSFTPYVFYVMRGRKKIVFSWTSNRSNETHNRAVNMKTFKKEGSYNHICLSINICQLADDLLSSLDKLIDKTQKSQSFKNGCIRRLNNSLRMKNCMIDKSIKPKWKRPLLRDQILLAKNQSAGILKRNNQVEWFNKAK
jgi:hypothetical protein